MVHLEPVEGVDDLHLLDTEGFRSERFVGVYLYATDPAVILETGASPSVDKVLAALDELHVAREDVALVAPTHIHLDHAGATGHLLEVLPNATAVLHGDFADYLASPERLLASVERAVGPHRFPLYGTCLPFEEDRIRRVKGGETLRFGDRTLEVHHAPGHAPHHVVFHDGASGTTFTGDAAGIHAPANGVVEETTPPPSFDLDASLETLDLLRDLDADRLAVTHFGVRPDPDAHLDAYGACLQDWVDEVEDAWRRRDGDLDAVVEEVVAAHPEWAPAYTSRDNVAIRRMDVTGARLWLERAGRLP